MKAKAIVVALAAVAILGLISIPFCIETVDPGHVKVGTLFGKVCDDEITEGLHIVNPIKNWVDYDCRDKKVDLQVSIQTQDQQTSTADVTVQFNVIDSSASSALADVGRFDDLVNVQLVPQTRSIARRIGKTITRAEELFEADTQAAIQANTAEELNNRLATKGLSVQRVLVRHIELPGHIKDAIKAKKVREQKAEEQKAELERFATEQEQKVKQATAERNAAEQQAEQIKLLADAEAYQIEKINTAVAGNPAYIQLQALESLREMSKDPATKMYFLNGESSQPFPLLNIGGDTALTK